MVNGVLLLAMVVALVEHTSATVKSPQELSTKIEQLKGDARKLKNFFTSPQFNDPEAKKYDVLLAKTTLSSEKDKLEIIFNVMSTKLIGTITVTSGKCELTQIQGATDFAKAAGYDPSATSMFAIARDSTVKKINEMVAKIGSGDF